MTEQVDQKQRVLKLVVIGLGLAIAVCVIIIVIGMGLRASRLGKDKPVDTAVHEIKGQGAVLGNVDVPVPYGAQVVAVTAAGKELHVLIDQPEGRQLLLIDRATGGVLGTLKFVPGAASSSPPAAVP